MLGIFVAASSAYAGLPTDFKGANCTLQTPPSESGEEALHGKKLLIYPRASQIKKDYMGCQSLWYPTARSQWLLATSVHIVNGQAVALWATDIVTTNQSTASVCRYKNGRAIGSNAKECPDYRFVIVKSLPAGCFEKVKATGQFPKECDYD
jgi:hypothetical protein